MPRKPKRGRPRHFKFGEIVSHTGPRTELAVVVDHRMRGSKSEYRVIPLSGGHKRYGRAAWRLPNELATAGEYSSTGSILTYRANEWLEDELPDGRGCRCQCCIHDAQPKSSFKRMSGEFKDD